MGGETEIFRPSRLRFKNSPPQSHSNGISSCLNAS
jgi:hypothetical protein